MNAQKRLACTSILIGKKASTDGSVMIGRNEDSRAAWPKHYVVHPHQELKSSPVFKSHDNQFKLNLPKVRYKYAATPEWTKRYGLFEEDGINEFNVAMSATESTYSNETVLGYDPLVKNGIGEEAMITVVLPYVKSARQGVQRLGKIIDKYGTDESNGILFADRNSAWYMETGGGHQWVAERIPDDCYAVVANQTAIQNVDFNDPKNFMWSPQIREFVKKYHLNPSQDGSFNFRQIFGTHNLADTYYNTPRVWYGQRMFNPEIHQDPQSQHLPFLMKSHRKLSVNDAEAFLSSHYQGTPYDPIGEGKPKDRERFRPVSLAKTQESHVLQIRPDQPKETTGIHWLAMGVAAQSTYVPFFSGITKTPTAYHRGTQDYQHNSAYWTFKLAGILVDGHYLQFNPQLEAVQSKLKIHYINSIKAVDANAKQLPKDQLIKLVNQVSNG
ncbi:MAG: C69 family dipeptidase [Acetilactobacillus jinshanensis]